MQDNTIIKENKDPYKDPPPAPPAVDSTNAKRSPVMPSPVKKRNGHPRAAEFQKPENATTMSTVFSIVIQHDAHKTEDGTQAAKKAWVQSIEDAYCNDSVSPGPLVGHTKWVGQEYQNKFKNNLVLANAEHFAKSYDEKMGKEGKGADFSSCELLGHQIWTERADANTKRANEKKRKTEEKEEGRRKKEAAEKYVGAVPTAKGVGAPSGVELSKDDLDVLAEMFQQPHSYTGMYNFTYVTCIISSHPFFRCALLFTS